MEVGVMLQFLNRDLNEPGDHTEELLILVGKGLILTGQEIQISKETAVGSKRHGEQRVNSIFLGCVGLDHSLSVLIESMPLDLFAAKDQFAIELRPQSTGEEKFFRLDHFLFFKWYAGGGYVPEATLLDIHSRD